LLLQLTDPALKVVLPPVSFIQRLPQAGFGFTGDHLRPPRCCVALFKFGDATSEEFVDDLELAHTSFE
jgi:hypothetical protein